MKLSIVLPSYLEEENLRILIPRIKTEISKITLENEIVIVDTSTPLDNTLGVCNENQVVYLNRKGGNTYGDAIRTGLSAAKGEYIVFMDADGSHPPEFIHELYNQRNSGDVIIASRYIEGGFTENSRPLILMSKIVNWGYSFILNIKCKDVSNSFRLYKGDFVRSLDLKCSNFDIVEEILYKLIKRNKSLKILEIPFSFKQRMFGQTKRNLFSFVFSYIFTLIRLRLMR